SHQLAADPADPVACHVASAMLSRHENYAPDCWPMLEDERLFEETLTLGRHLYFGGRTAEGLQPEFRPGIGDQRSGDASTHAMSYHHHFFAQRIFLFDGVKLLAEDERAIGIGITA